MTKNKIPRAGLRSRRLHVEKLSSFMYCVNSALAYMLPLRKKLRKLRKRNININRHLMRNGPYTANLYTVYSTGDKKRKSYRVSTDNLQHLPVSCGKLPYDLRLPLVSRGVYGVIPCKTFAVYPP